ncbi:helicase [Terramyces sp. JEL0728]|nr:helicase [Terramyces sp. JEL0728]
MFKCLYRKKQTKKHSTWDSDGYLKLGASITLLDEDKQILKTTAMKKIDTEIINVGGLEVLVPLDEITVYMANGTGSLPDDPVVVQKQSSNAPLKPMNKTLKSLPNLKKLATVGLKKPLARTSSNVIEKFKVIYKKKGSKNWENDGILTVDGPQSTITSDTGNVIASISTPGTTNGTEFTAGSRTFQITDTFSANSPKKTKLVQSEFKTPLIGYKKPQLHGSTNVIKPGSVLMTRPNNGNVRDVVLDQFIANEMGLGKTVQAVTLIWILTKQSPYVNVAPPVKRTLIVCPASLVSNWHKEIKKWLGIRMNAYKAGDSVRDFFVGRIYSVLIVGYEKLKKFQDEILKGNFDLCICDEDLLGSIPDFKRKFEKEIIEEKSREKINQFLKLSSSFVLRRTSEINQKFLPPKVESVVFCEMFEKQTECYKEKLDMLDEDENILSSLQDLRKISNCSSLYDENLKGGSGKFRVIRNLLRKIKDAGEKVVIVSHYTKTLDVFDGFLATMSCRFNRLDGSTASTKRQELVDHFNNDKNIFAFLLSAKAGGVGLNLIGASRLILIDIDWNPAVDQQAMARIWREGQKHPVFIYRFISSGTIEERILHRQMYKTEIANQVIDSQISTKSFSKEEMRELTTLHEGECLVHELSECTCMDGLDDGIVDRRHFNRHHVDSNELLDYRDILLNEVLKENKNVSFLMITNTTK